MTTTYQTDLSVSIQDAHTLFVTFNTLPGNQPQSYGNYIAIWQNQNLIPYNQAPLKVFPITGNTQAGSQNIAGLTLTTDSYIVGFAVGPNLPAGQQTYGNIISSVFIPANAGPQTAVLGSIAKGTVGSTSINFAYAFPSGNTPQTNGAWVGLWEGSAAAYGNPPTWGAQIPADLSSGTAFINNVSIGRGATYTVALYSSGWNSAGPSRSGLTAMVATQTFSV